MHLDATTRLSSERAKTFLRRAETLRQIHSNKARKARRWSSGYTIATLVVSTGVTFIGFAGFERLARFLKPVVSISESSFEMFFNLFVLAIVILAILGLMFRFEERSYRHNESIERLTEFIRDVEDLTAFADAGLLAISQSDLTSIRERYKGILISLPPSSDKEYLQSKKDYAAKLAKREEAERSRRVTAAWRDETSAQVIEKALGGQLAGLLFADSSRRRVLEIVRDTLGSDFWIVGGAVRDPAWDSIHGYGAPTGLDDIDVVYFDRDSSRAEESDHEGRLRLASANLEWSVKNEAHMHTHSGDAPYESFEDALEHFPETASAVGVQIDDSNIVRIVAPLGLSDLFEGVVAPPPKAQRASYRSRVLAKNWKARWPNLNVESFDPT